MYSDNYYIMANVDLESVRGNFENGVRNSYMAYTCNSICQQYLKSIIEVVYGDVIGRSKILRRISLTHSIVELENWLKYNINDFVCDWDKVRKIDRFTLTESDSYITESDRYITTSFVDGEDIRDCWSAVLSLRDSVEDYRKKFCKEDDIEQYYTV